MSFVILVTYKNAYFGIALMWLTSVLSLVPMRYFGGVVDFRGGFFFPLSSSFVQAWVLSPYLRFYFGSVGCYWNSTSLLISCSYNQLFSVYSKFLTFQACASKRQKSDVFGSAPSSSK